MEEIETTTCAERLELGTIGFQLHLFTSYVTPTGSTQTRYWVNYFREMHHESFAMNQWNAFMAMRTTFYAPDLTPFYRKLANDEVPMLRIRYINPIDSNVIWSIFVVIPNTGYLIEVISDKIYKNFGKKFGEFPMGACRPANWVMQSTATMKEQWRINKGKMNYEGSNLPSLLNVMNSFASYHTSDFVSFWHLFDNSAPMKIATSIDIYGADAPGRENKCSYQTVRLKLGETNTGIDQETEADIRAVVNPTAPVFDETVEDWVMYVHATHENYTGTTGHGWDRYLDNHFGLYHESGADLDILYPKVSKKQLDWHAHIGHTGGSEGSIWTSGFDGQGIEFHGNFSRRFSANLDELDYCSKDSSRHDMPSGTDDDGDDGEFFKNSAHH